MAGRGFSAAALVELGAQRCVTGHLVDVELDAGTVYMTDLARPVIFGGHTYSALGHFLAYDSIQETADLQIPEVRLQLSGVDQTWIARVLAQPLVDRRVVIYQAFLDTTTLALIVDPSAIFDGRISDSSIDESAEQGSSVVTVAAASHWVDFERRSGRRTNHAEQQMLFAGDLAFEFTGDTARPVFWMGAAMIVTVAAEPFSLWWKEAGELFVAHWREVGIFREEIPLEVDVARIVELERAGAWLAWAVRDAGTLVGYACVLVSTHLHYASHRFGLVDVVYLKPGYRGAGIGAMLLREVERGSRDAGCARMVVHVKLAHDFGPLLERSGYVATETNWERLL